MMMFHIMFPPIRWFSLVSLLSPLLLAGCSETLPASVAIADPTPPPTLILSYPTPILPTELTNFPLPTSVSLVLASSGGTSSATWESSGSFETIANFYADPPSSDWTFERLPSLLNEAVFTARLNNVVSGELVISQGPPTRISLHRGLIFAEPGSSLTPTPLPTPLNYPMPGTELQDLPDFLLPPIPNTLVANETLGDLIYAIWETGASLEEVVDFYRQKLSAAQVSYQSVTSASGTGLTTDSAVIAITQFSGGTRISIQSEVVEQ